MTREEQAIDYFKAGYSCAQAVIMAFSDVLPIEIEHISKFSAAFGGGFAKMRGNCGAVAAMGMAAGFLTPQSGNVEEDKKAVYKATRDMVDAFVQLNGTINCAELLKNIKNITTDYVPSPRNKEYYASRPCVKFVSDAVKIIEDYNKLN